MSDDGYNVGYVAAGEYLRYTLDVTKKSERHQYNALRLSVVVTRTRVSSTSGARFCPSREHHVTCDSIVAKVVEASPVASIVTVSRFAQLSLWCMRITVLVKTVFLAVP